MRRMILLTAILALVGMVALPAGAEPVSKTAYTIAECPAEGNPQNASEMKMWQTGHGGLHVRGAENLYNDFVLEGGVWVEFGTLTSVAGANISSQSPAFGTFAMETLTIGDFEGRWSWGSAEFGHGAGRSDDGRLVKVTLGLSSDDLPTLPGEPDECLVAEYVVFSH